MTTFIPCYYYLHLTFVVMNGYVILWLNVLVEYNKKEHQNNRKLKILIDLSLFLSSKFFVRCIILYRNKRHSYCVFENYNGV